MAPNPRTDPILDALDGGAPLLYAEDRKARRESAEAEVARLRWIEEAARECLHQFHLWSEDANDGEFAIWREEDFMASFHALQMAFNGTPNVATEPSE